MVGVVGDLGTGKTLLLCLLQAMELDAGKLTFSNFHMFDPSSNRTRRYVSPLTGRSSVFVPPHIFREVAKAGKTRFPLGGASIYLDEAYIYVESRSPNRQVTDFSYMILQSRKMGLDVEHSEQLTTSLDKRLRFLSSNWILCELKNKGNPYEGFEYTFMDNDGTILNKRYMTKIAAAKSGLFNMYDTQEIVMGKDEAEDSITDEEIELFYNAIAPYSQLKV